MAQFIRSFRRLALYLIITLILTIIILYLFHQFIAEPISLSKLIEQAVKIVISVSAWLTAIIIIRHFKPHMTQRMGVQAATLVQYVLLLIAILIMTFGILSILQVSAITLLAGAGIISVTGGVIISAFVGSVLSSFLVFTNYKFKVGDNVMVNNIPGKVVEMRALVIRIQTDIGQITIPNSAISSGGVIITVVRENEKLEESRLHYVPGDRVVTSYMNEQGIVKEITSFYTVIRLDSGKEITFLNSSILSGAVVIAKITAISK
jgi:small-conductance mechanosensitive channel